MPTKRKQAQPARWKGDGVQDAPEGEAEQAADRAEGKTAIDVAEAAQRSSEDESVDLPRAAGDHLTPEEKIAEVAEEHQEREAAEGRGPRGKL
jgi:hypothetical protein